LCVWLPKKVIKHVAVSSSQSLSYSVLAPPLTSIQSARLLVSKTFLYDPKHSDLAQQIRSLRQVTPQSTATKSTRSSKSDSAKDAQIARFKERVRALEEQVRSLQEENELLYGKLSERAFKLGEILPALA
jgi:hypothetical protein